MEILKLNSIVRKCSKGNNVKSTKMMSHGLDTEQREKLKVQQEHGHPAELFFEVLFPDRLVISRCLFPIRQAPSSRQGRPLGIRRARWALVHNADGAFVCGILDWRLVVRHTADVVLLRRYEMSALINHGRWEPFASATVCRNRLCSRVCVSRVSASVKSRGECTCTVTRARRRMTWWQIS